MLRRASLAIALFVVVGTRVAAAVERPIDAGKLLLRRSASGSEKLTFVSKDPTFLFPTSGGPDDPSPSGSGGLVVELFAPGTPSGVTLTVPGGVGVPGWIVRATTPPRLQFKNAGAPAAVSVFRSITLKQGRVLKLSGKESGLDLSAPLGSVGIRITTGSLVNCALFHSATVRKDSDGTFSAKNTLASALADCSDASLAGSVTITTTSTVTTTTGVCGDDAVNQSSEQCDGTDRSACEGLDCGPPGASTACLCCGLDQVPTFPVAAPCCDPTATQVYFPSTAICVTHDCSGPFTCNWLGTCQGGSCCAPTGSACAVFGGGGSGAGVPCCDPAAVCHATSSDSACCFPDGGGCSDDVACCSGHCASGTCSP